MVDQQNSRKKKKILFAINDMNIGGTEKSLLNLLSLLPENRYEVTVLMLEKSGGYLQNLPPHILVETVGESGRIKKTADEPLTSQIKESIRTRKLIHALRLGRLYLSVKTSKNWNLLNQFALKNYKNTKQYDIAVAYAGPYFLLSELVLNKISAPVKYQWIHFDISQLNIEKALGVRLFSAFDQIFCVSKSSRNSFVQQFPEFSSKTAVFENVINKTEAQTLAGNVDPYASKPSTDFVRILTVGRLSAEKGQDLIPRICHLLAKDNIDFTWYLVGDGSLRTRILEEAEKYGVSEKIVFCGTQPNPFPYFKYCDIYVQTSLQEGFGITIAEAKLFAKPLVTTNVASASDLISNQKSGLITGFTAEDIYTAMKTLIENPELRESLAAQLLTEAETDAGILIDKYFENA